MIQKTQALSDGGKRKLALQFLGTLHTPEASIELIADWDIETALAALAELLTHVRRYSRYSLQDLKQELPYEIFSFLVYLIPLAIDMKWLGFFCSVILYVASAFMTKWLFPFRAKILSQRLIWALEFLLPKATPAMLPTVLEVASVLGSPEHNPVLRKSLTRLLPFFDRTSAQRLTEKQHRYLLRLLHTSYEELRIAALLAIGTLGDPRDAVCIREAVQSLGERVREAKRECLVLLGAAEWV